MMTYGMDLVRRFNDEEDGLALTEYLILLGLMTAAVITAVALFGENLGLAWGDWATWAGSLVGSAPVDPVVVPDGGV